jgi:glyoxylase-like metal-dependent hydrolase (beta-lactamase superfamily II)
MRTWRIGDVTVTRVVELLMPIPYRPEAPFLPGATPEALRRHPWLYPHFVSEKDELLLSIHALLVEAPGLRLVVDTCMGDNKPGRPGNDRPRVEPFLAALAELGWTRESVDAVVCTHLHIDHVGWNTMLEGDRWVPTFPRARYLIGRKELLHWTADEDAEQQQVMADSVTPILDAGLAELVEPDYRITPEIRLIPSAGHTPGHVSVMIESQGETAVITGDMAHHPCQMAHPDWCPGVDCDPAEATATRRRMFGAWAEQPVLVIGTHFAEPTAGHVRLDGDAFRFEV